MKVTSNKTKRNKTKTRKKTEGRSKEGGKGGKVQKKREKNTSFTSQRTRNKMCFLFFPKSTSLLVRLKATEPRGVRPRMPSSEGARAAGWGRLQLGARGVAVRQTANAALGV